MLISCESRTVLHPWAHVILTTALFSGNIRISPSRGENGSLVAKWLAQGQLQEHGKICGLNPGLSNYKAFLFASILSCLCGKSGEFQNRALHRMGQGVLIRVFSGKLMKIIFQIFLRDLPAVMKVYSAWFNQSRDLWIWLSRYSCQVMSETLVHRSRSSEDKGLC